MSVYTRARIFVLTLLTLRSRFKIQDSSAPFFVGLYSGPYFAYAFVGIRRLFYVRTLLTLRSRFKIQGSSAPFFCWLMLGPIFCLRLNSYPLAFSCSYSTNAPAKIQDSSAPFFCWLILGPIFCLRLNSYPVAIFIFLLY